MKNREPWVEDCNCVKKEYLPHLQVCAPKETNQDNIRNANPEEATDDIIQRLQEENAALKQFRLDITIAENTEKKQ